jgi:hypothetical protein
MKLKLKYYTMIGEFKAWLWAKRFDVKNFIWFQQRAFNSLLAKEMIMDSCEATSKARYKYYQLEISLCPLSKTKTIDNKRGS